MPILSFLPGGSRIALSRLLIAATAVAALSGVASAQVGSGVHETGRSLLERTEIIGPVETFHVTTRGQIIEGGGIAGSCPETTSSHTDANFAGGSFVVQAGFAQGEIAAASYTLPASAFPIKIDLMEAIFATSNANQQTVTHWSILVWDGTPSTGTIVAQYSSDDEILPHLRCGPGTAGVNIQVSVDPGDPEQIFVNDNSGTHTFSIGYRIDQHNQPPANPCTQSPATCCNAFPTTDTSGLQHSTGNWLFGLNCGAFGCPANGGWASFNQLPGFCRPSGDWVMRATWESVNCSTPVGACCNGGNCTVSTQADCSNTGGTYQGDGVVCNPTLCALATGACCVLGQCDQHTQPECQSMGGTYFGDLTSCASVNCPQPTGACCFVSTGGCVNLTQQNCEGAGGIYHGAGTACATTVCFPRGACCMPNGSCSSNVAQGDCEAAGGTFQGNNSDCGSVSCPLPQGSCCFPSTFCITLTQGDCASAGGSWGGGGTSCNTPRIITQPTAPAHSCDGAAVSLSVVVCGNGPTYQWRQYNGATPQNIPGANGSTYAINPTTPQNSGNYDVLVSGSVASNTVHVSTGTRCDANCDGIVDNSDIDAFVLALISGHDVWVQTYPCDFICSTDTNRDGAMDNSDIDSFVQCLVGG